MQVTSLLCWSLEIIYTTQEREKDAKLGSLKWFATREETTSMQVTTKALILEFSNSTTHKRKRFKFLKSKMVSYEGWEGV